MLKTAEMLFQIDHNSGSQTLQQSACKNSLAVRGSDPLKSMWAPAKFKYSDNT